MSSLTRPHVVSNPYEFHFLWNIKYILRTVEKLSFFLISMEVNGHQMVCYHHSSDYLLLCYAEAKKNHTGFKQHNGE